MEKYKWFKLRDFQGNLIQNTYVRKGFLGSNEKTVAIYRYPYGGINIRSITEMEELYELGEGVTEIENKRIEDRFQWELNR